MKYTYLLLVFSLITNSSILHAQSYKLTTSELRKPSSYPNELFIFLEDSHYYVLRSEKKSETIDKYNFDHELVGQKPYEETTSPLFRDNRKIIKTSDGKYLYTPTWNNRNSQFQFKVSKFENEGLSTPKIAHEYRMDPNIANSLYIRVLILINEDIASTIQVSENGEYVVYARIVESRDKGKEKFLISVFDSKFNPVWEKIQDFEYDDKQLKIESVDIDNEGKVFLSTKYFQDTKKTKTKEEEVHYTSKVFTVTKDELKEYDINLGTGNFPIRLSLYLNVENTNFIATGFYKNSTEVKGFQGIYYCTNTGNTEMDKVVLNPFENLEMKDLISEEDKEESNGLSSRNYIYMLVYFDDGTLGFITNSSSYDKNHIIDTDRKIIFVRFSLDGKIKIFKPIIKCVSSNYHTKVLPLFISSRNGDLYLIYDNKKLINPKSKVKRYSPHEIELLVSIRKWRN